MVVRDKQRIIAHCRRHRPSDNRGILCIFLPRAQPGQSKNAILQETRISHSIAAATDLSSSKDAKATNIRETPQDRVGRSMASA